jgi:hypothetical protein
VTIEAVEEVPAHDAAESPSWAGKGLMKPLQHRRRPSLSSFPSSEEKKAAEGSNEPKGAVLKPKPALKRQSSLKKVEGSLDDETRGIAAGT